MNLHTDLKTFVTTYGRTTLSNPYLPGMLDDGLLFRGADVRPYRALFRLLVQQHVPERIVAMDAWDAPAIETITKHIETLYNGTANIAYAMECLGFAAGLVDEMTTVADVASLNKRIDAQEYDLTERTVKYIPHGSNKCIGTEIPIGMAHAVHSRLKEIEHEEGSVIDFVAAEMGESPREIEDKISGEQIDGVAMSIRQMRSGRGFILGDMTGVGKGRQLAMLIKWATLQGDAPVVVTEKSTLFTDLFRDLYDVGYGSLRPFILNSDRDARILDRTGNVLYNLPAPQEMADFLQSGTIPAGFDFLLLTYSQMSRTLKDNPKAQAMLKCVSGSYLILDESHNATGIDSNIGATFREAVRTCAGVCFSSATYAKYPASMPIYALKTAIGEAKIPSDELIEIISKGGPILQEVMAKGLVESGSMIRRQRNMDGIENTLYCSTDAARIDRVREQYNGLVGLISDIRNFQDQYIKPFLADKNAESVVRTHVRAVPLKATFTSAKIVFGKFSTRVTPTIRQLLFAIKARDAVDVTLRELRAGRKPIVQIAHTMESTLKRLIDSGESLARADFALVLLMALNSLFSYKAQGTANIPVGRTGTIKRTYSTEPIAFTVADLKAFFGNPDAELAFNSLVSKIRAYDSGLPLSPVDYFVEMIQQAGYRVGELTQRANTLQYVNPPVRANDPAAPSKRDNKSKKLLADRFNDGAIDVLVGNRVMASGISLHSSPVFADRRQRVVITWEAQDRADLQTQFNGRADRTGQLQHCAFVTIASAIPAEQRFLMMNNRKQMSLNANVEASQHTDGPVVDILNKYGAQVAKEFLKENPEFNELIELPEHAWDFKGKKSPVKELMTGTENLNFINEFMRALCLLDCCEQEEILEDVLSRYTDLIRQLDEAGENDLQSAPRKLNATVLRRQVFCKGLPYSTSVFGQDATLEEMEVDALRTPMTARQISELQAKLLSPAEIVAQVNHYRDARITGIKAYYQRLKDNAESQRKALQASGVTTPQYRLKQLDLRANNTEGMQRQIDVVHQWVNDLTRLAMRFKQGQAVGIPVVVRAGVLCENPIDIDSTVSPGIFLGYKVTSSQCTPSNIKAVFAVNDSRRTIYIPLSAQGKMDCIFNQTHLGVMTDRLKGVSVRSWDKLVHVNRRERAYIITGNIILGIARARRMGMDTVNVKARELISGMCSGMLINFTDDAGRIRSGYQLPHSFNPAYIQRYAK